MTKRAGQKPGHDEEPRLPGYSWADYLGALVVEHGTLTAVAWKLLERSDGEVDDVASVERALRRLRTRGQRDGGVWGQRLVRVFGVPGSVESRMRWMGLYHSPFNDLPLSLCLDQLRVWDRPPVSTSRARLWLSLGYVTCALRRRQPEDAAAHLEQAAAALAGLPQQYDAARVELALVRAFTESRDEPAAAVERWLDEAERLLATAQLEPADLACFRARLVDQRAFQLNRARHPDDDARALALYQSLPASDEHPFASYRRDAGLAWGHARAGRRDEALRLAVAACEHAGDGGYTRLRVMGLLLQAKIAGPGASDEVLRRARTMATRLEDEELLRRLERLKVS